MGNYKFRFSDMMPNAWFYKLKDMGSSRRTRNQKNTTTSTSTSTTTYAMKKKQPNSSPTTTAAHPQKQKQPHHHHLSQSRKSYYFTRDPITSFDTFYNSLTNTNYPTPEDTAHFPDPPRKSSKQGPKKKTRKSSASPKKLVTSTVSAGCNCRASFDSVWTRSDFSLEFSVSPSDSSPDKELLIGQSLVPESRSDEALTTQSFDGMVAAWSSSCRCKSNSNAKDIVIDMENKPEARKFDKINGFDSIPEIDLPPIITKPEKFDQMVNDFSIKETKKQGIHRKSSAKTEERKTATALKEQSHSPVKRFSGKSPGVRLRVKSPRIANMTQGRRSVSSSSSSSSRRSISDSFAVMKTSFNPQKDFKESMLEMIVENNIRASKDLEELLACYLSLNSDEYHDLIIKVFKQIWFDLTDIQRK